MTGCNAVRHGDGTLQDRVNLSAAAAGPWGIASADFNLDGKLDVVTANNEGTVSIRLGNGAGGFGIETQYTTSSGLPMVVVADLNRDGKPTW